MGLSVHSHGEFRVVAENGCFHQRHTKSLASGLSTGQDSSQPLEVVFDECAGIGHQVVVTIAQKVARYLIFAVEIQIGTILLHDKNFSPQFEDLVQRLGAKVVEFLPKPMYGVGGWCHGLIVVSFLCFGNRAGLLGDPE